MKIFDLFKDSIKDKRTWIPNLLTSSRLIGTFVIPALFYSGNYLGAFLAAMVFSATDFFDGRVARKYCGYSEFGKLLDPIVDKVFAVGLTLAILPLMPILTINVCLEGVIGFINSKSFNNNGKPKSSYLGKFKTFCLFPTISLAYLSAALNINVLDILTVFTSISTGIVQGVVAYDYYKKANNVSEEEPLKVEEETTNKEKAPIKELTRKELIETLKKERDNLISKEEKPKIMVKRK